MSTLSTRGMSRFELEETAAHGAGEHDRQASGYCPHCRFSGRLVNGDGTVTSIDHLTVWKADGSSGASGSLDYVGEAVRLLQRDGAFQTRAGWQPANHHVIGVGVGHNDADFAETGVSMAAWYENGEAYGGRWWENSEQAFLSGARKEYNRIDGSLA